MDTAIARPELLLVAECRRARKEHRPRGSAGGDGTGHPEGRTCQIRARKGHPRDDRPQDRRCAPVPLDRDRRNRRERRNPDGQRRSRPSCSPTRRSASSSSIRCRRSILAASPAQTAKQVIVQRVREYERKQQYDEFKDRVGEIINGVVKRTEYGNLMVELGRAEALLRRDELIAARKFPQRRPRARLYLRRARRTARSADLPVAHPSRLPRQAVRAGSAGNL